MCCVCSLTEGEWVEGLSVTGLAITPERKPRVPTMSERDLTRQWVHRARIDRDAPSWVFTLPTRVAHRYLLRNHSNTSTHQWVSHGLIDIYIYIRIAARLLVNFHSAIYLLQPSRKVRLAISENKFGGFSNFSYCFDYVNSIIKNTAKNCIILLFKTILTKSFYFWKMLGSNWFWDWFLYFPTVYLT